MVVGVALAAVFGDGVEPGVGAIIGRGDGLSEGVALPGLSCAVGSRDCQRIAFRAELMAVRPEPGGFRLIVDKFPLIGHNWVDPAAPVSAQEPPTAATLNAASQAASNGFGFPHIQAELWPQMADVFDQTPLLSKRK